MILATMEQMNRYELVHGHQGPLRANNWTPGRRTSAP